MLPRSRSGRRLFAGAGLVLAAALLVLAVRGIVPPYSPEAPEYRQRGPAGAPIVIAVFSDFQCGGCRAVARPIERVEKMFPGEVRVMFKHLPWDFHRRAKDAAGAAECAGKGGRFWEFHDLLFNDQSSWADAEETGEARDAFLALAKRTDLDLARYRDCIEDKSVLALVESDIKEADERWINTTPTIWINGRRFVGALQLRTHGLNHIEDILDR